MARLSAFTSVALAVSIGVCAAFSVSEEDGDDLEPCGNITTLPFTATIRTEWNDCASRASYDWAGAFRPTTAERQELCACTLLMNKLQKVTVPYCGFYRKSHDGGSSFLAYKETVEYAFGLCSTSTTAKPVTKTPAPPATTSYYDSLPTYAPYTYSPSFDLDTSTSSSSKKSKSKTGLIVGILVAVVVVAAIAAFIVRKKKNKNQKKEETVGDTPARKSSHMDVTLDAGTNGELSPLGVETVAYKHMPTTPSAPPAPKRVV